MSTKALVVEFDQKKIDAIVSPVIGSHLPGAAVGIAIGGRPVYRKGFGLASMELPVVLSPSTRMRIYSTTKHFVCLAYMLLCEEGRAGIDDPVGKYLPELHPVTHSVRIRHLMGNTSGLRDSHDIFWQFSGMEREVSSGKLLSFYRDIDDVSFVPGTAWSYNNGGFLILSAVVERVTGRTLEEVFRTRIFEPAGMYDTLLRRLNTEFVSNSATMHMTNLTGGFDRSMPYLPGALAGEGGLVSTIDDMLRWLRNIEAPVVGSVGTWADMKAPHILANGVSTAYGFGLVSGRYRGVDTLFNAGGGMGANSQMLTVPAAGLGVVVIVNRHDLSSMLLVDQILDACLPELEGTRKPFGGPFVVGSFCSPTSGRIIQLAVEHGRQIAWIDNYKIEFESDGNGVLWPAPPFSQLKQSMIFVGDRESPTALRFNDFGNEDELPRVRTVDEPDASALIGCYRSDATRTEATICESGADIVLRTVGRFGSATFELVSLADGVWRAVSRLPWMGGVLSVNRDEKGFRFSTARNRALPFRRVV
jgi:D-aminopeptidase